MARLGGHVSAVRVLGLVAPEIFKARWRKFSVPNGVLNVPMAQVVLDRSRIVSITRQLVAGGMAQHVRMRLERQFCFLACPFN